jgi:hypothetical protein
MCEEYVRLLAVYKQALKLYRTTVEAVGAASGIPSEEFGRVVGYADQAKTATRVATEELEHHCEDHGCAHFRRTARASELTPLPGFEDARQNPALES